MRLPDTAIVDAAKFCDAMILAVMEALEILFAWTLEIESDPVGFKIRVEESWKSTRAGEIMLWFTVRLLVVIVLFTVK
jgi:hypothetical protein